MKKFKKEFTFELEQPILYNGKDNDIEVKTLVLSAPTNAQSEMVDKMRQIIMQAFMSAGRQQGATSTTDKNAADDAGQAEIEAEGILFVLTLNGLTDVKNMFRELITGKICLLKGQYESTEYLLNQIYHDEFELLMGEYIANFIIPSWMKGLRKKKTN